MIWLGPIGYVAFFYALSWFLQWWWDSMDPNDI